MMKKTRRHYDAEFKRMAVDLVESSGKTASSVAKELGIAPDLVARWRRELQLLGEGSFSGHGKANLSLEQREILELKKQLQEVQIERDILKKAVSIFSRSNEKF